MKNKILRNLLLTLALGSIIAVPINFKEPEQFRYQLRILK